MKKSCSKNNPKERNPFVTHIVTKRSGPHGKTKKAERRQDKISLKKKVYDDRLHTI